MARPITKQQPLNRDSATDNLKNNVYSGGQFSSVIIQLTVCVLLDGNSCQESPVIHEWENLQRSTQICFSDAATVLRDHRFQATVTALLFARVGHFNLLELSMNNYQVERA